MAQVVATFIAVFLAAFFGAAIGVLVAHWLTVLRRLNLPVVPALAEEAVEQAKAKEKTTPVHSPQLDPPRVFAQNRLVKAWWLGQEAFKRSVHSETEE